MCQHGRLVDSAEIMVVVRSGLALCVAAASASIAKSGPLPFGHPSASASYPTREGFTLWLVEEFEEPLDLDLDSIWTWSDGGLSEGQVRFVKEAIKFEDGKAVLEANWGSPPEVQPCSHAEKMVVPPKSLTSGELRTRHNWFRYGYYEVSMKAPSVQPGNADVNGNFVSTMFAYRDAKFKHWREIDIEVTGDSTSSITMNVLSAENTPMWNPSIQASQHLSAPGINVRAGFNTYAFEWLPSGITWYLNGQVIGRHQGSLPVPDLSTKIMMNLWVFSSIWAFGGKEGWNNRYPLRSEYDWFRFYRWDGDSNYPCAEMGTDCLTPDDQYLTSNNPCDGIPQVGTVYGSPACVAVCDVDVYANDIASASTSSLGKDSPAPDQDEFEQQLFFP